MWALEGHSECVGISQDPLGHFRVHRVLSSVPPYTHHYSPGDNFTDHSASVAQLEAFVSLGRERVCPKEFLMPKFKVAILIKAKLTVAVISRRRSQKSNNTCSGKMHQVFGLNFWAMARVRGSSKCVA